MFPFGKLYVRSWKLSISQNPMALSSKKEKNMVINLNLIA